jgi:hypothetical protein
MFPLTPGYDRHMFAYLQAWRQFLEQWAAMVPMAPWPTAPWGCPAMPFMPAGGQFMPPTAPFMPPMPPTPTAPAPPMPPAPADYTQQLFSYLQAWRQYLEQMTGAGSGSPQASAAQQPTAENRPTNDGGSKPIPSSDVSKGSNPAWPPSQLDIQPESPGGSQVVSIGFGQSPSLVDLPPTSEYRSEFRRPGFDQPSPFGHGPDEAQLLNPPDYAFGYRDRSNPETLPATVAVYPAEPEAGHTSEAPAQLPVNSPFSAIMERVEPGASSQAAAQSLFSSPGAQTASEKLGEAGQTPSP